MPSARYVRQAAAWNRRRYRRAWGPAIRTEPATITFPDTPLVSQARIALTPDPALPWWQWGWVDITEYVRWEQGVTIVAGRRDQSDRVDASMARLTIDNRDGRFSRKNVFGPYYGFLTRNTPIWLAVNPGTGFADRYFGYVNEWPKRWDRSATDSTVDVVCGGIMRRLQRSQPLRSAMFRTVSGVAEGDYVPHAYWSMEDGADATRLAGSLVGTPEATFTGTMTPASDDSLPGSRPLPVLDAGASIFMQIPTYTSTGKWVLQFLINVLAAPAGTVTIADIAVTGSTVTRWVVTLNSLSSLNSFGYDASGALVMGVSGTVPSSFYGVLWNYSLAVYESGTDLTASVHFFDGLGNTRGPFGLTEPSLTAGTPTSIVLDGGEGNTSFGHAALFVDTSFDPDEDVGATADAMYGHIGEQAHERVRRLCREARIPVFVMASNSAALGPEPTTTLMDALRDAEKADQGVLFEHEFGLGYQALSERYNRPVRFELDIAEGHLTDDLEPDDSDLRFHNQWTANRADGSSATVQARDGVAGIELSTTEAVYDAEETFGVQADEQLDDIAGWLAHRDSLDDDYWPNVGFSLAKHPSLIPAWLALGYGERMNLDNVMSQAGVDQLDLIIEGHAERWNSKEWQVILNNSPAGVFNVFELDHEFRGRLDSGSSTLVSAASVGASSLLVYTSDADALWTTDSAEFPLDVDVSGLTVEVTTIASSVRDTYTRTEAAGSFGTSDSLHTYQLSGTATDFSVNGSQGVIAPTAVNSERHATVDVGVASAQEARIWCTLPSIPTGAPINWGLLLYYSDASNYYWADVQVSTTSTLTLRLIKRVGGVATQITTAAAHVAHSTTVPRVLRASYTPSTGAFKARAWSSDADEPTDAWHVSTTDTSVPAGTRVGAIGRLMTGNTNVSPELRLDNFALLNPQLFTVTGADVTKSLTAGDAVHVAHPVVLAV